MSHLKQGRRATGCQHGRAEGHDEGHETVALKRQFSLQHGVAICIGLMLGISMYISPTGVVKGTHSGGLALIAWAVCGLYSVLGGLVFSEVGTTFPRSGFLYVYLGEYFGPPAAFLFLWEYFFFHRGASNAIKCLTFAMYALEPFFVGCDVPESAVKMVAILVAAVFTFINIVNVKVSARAQVLFVTGVVLSFAFIVAVAVYHAATGGKLHLDNLFEDINPDVGEIVMGFYSAIYAYGGWEALGFMMDEVRNPEKVLPLSIGISLFLVTIIFTIINFCYQMVLGAQGIMAAHGVAASMLERVIGGGSAITAILITFNTAGSFNSGTLVGSRLGYASAQQGQLPTVLSLVHVKYLTPVTSLLFQFLMVVTCCVVGDVFYILNNMVFAYYCFKTLTVAGNIWHRVKYPDFHRPLKMPLVVPCLLLVLSLVLLLVPLVTKPMSCVIGFTICLGTGIPYYIIFIMKPLRMPWLDYFSNQLLVFLQKTLNAALPDIAKRR